MSGNQNKFLRLIRFYSIIFTVLTCSFVNGQVYTDVASVLGVDHTFGMGAFGGGVSFVDFNQDGLDDLKFASQETDQISFYENVGGTFVRLDPPLVSNTDQIKQILWVDFDNDADKDLYVSGFDAPNILYVNDGNLNFPNQIVFPPPAGFSVGPTFGATFGDYDIDGDLDLLICNKTEHLDIPNQLFENNGDGSFTDITSSFFFDSLYQATFCAAFVDYNGDLLPDIYTAEDKISVNQMYKNLGNGVFQDITSTCGAGIVIDAMCVAVGDYDHDQDVDIYVSNTPGGNALLRNEGSDTFADVAAQSGVGFYSTGWASTFFDYDNDLDLDLYVSGSTAIGALKSLLYKNEGSSSFSVASEAGFVGDSTRSFSHAIGDLNNDGYYDIAVSTNAPDSSQLWLSSGGTNNWIKIALEGVLSNRDGIGAWIEVYVGAEKYIRYTHCGIGYLGQNSNNEIVGLGSHSLIDQIKVRWPSGIVDEYSNISVNQKIIVTEGTSATSIVSPGSLVANIHPNPTKSQVNITIPETERISEIHLLSADGQHIQSPDLRANQIHVRDLESGVYFITIVAESGATTTKKLVIY